MSLPDRLKEKIVDPREFNQRYRTDRNLRSQVAAYGTYSLGHFMSGVGVDDFQLNRYSYQPEGDLNLVAVKPVLKALNPYEPIRFRPDTIVENRWYGFSQTYIELSSLLAGEDEVRQALYDEELFAFSRLLHWWKSSPGNWSLEKLLQIERQYRRHTLHRSQQLVNSEYRRDYASVRKLYPTDQELEGFLQHLDTYRGVQVICGPREPFIEHVAQTAECLSDPAISIKVDIPSRLILAVLPLGEGEKKVLT